MKTKWIAVIILIMNFLFSVSCFDGNYIIRNITDPMFDIPFTVTVINGTGGGEYKEGDTVTITANIITGHVFKNWTVNSGGVTLANADSDTTTFTMTKNDVRVTANFDVFADPSAKAITSFTINSVSGVINEAAKTISVTLPSGTDVTALTPAIIHTGASISPASGSEQDFTTTVTYTVTAADNSTADYTVTVTVAPPGTYIVTWYADGGTPAPAQTTVTQGGSINAPAAMTKTGYTFDGWYTTSAFTDPAVIFPIDNVIANVNLYAKWNVNSYTITYNPNGGTGTPPASPTTASHGSSVTLSSIGAGGLSRTGYTFNGWSTQSTGGPMASILITADVVLYAQWLAGPDIPVLSVSGGGVLSENDVITLYLVAGVAYSKSVIVYNYWDWDTWVEIYDKVEWFCNNTLFYTGEGTSLSTSNPPFNTPGLKLLTVTGTIDFVEYSTSVYINVVDYTMTIDPSDLYGTWTAVVPDGASFSTITLTIDANKVEMVNSNGAFWTIEYLTWSQILNFGTNADYLEGYRITGMYTDSSTPGNLYNELSINIFIHTNRQSLLWRLGTDYIFTK